MPKNCVPSNWLHTKLKSQAIANLSLPLLLKLCHICPISSSTVNSDQIILSRRCISWILAQNNNTTQIGFSTFTSFHLPQVTVLTSYDRHFLLRFLQCRYGFNICVLYDIHYFQTCFSTTKVRLKYVNQLSKNLPSTLTSKSIFRRQYSPHSQSI